VTQERDRWTSTIKRIKESGKAAAIWGSGSKCVAFLTTLGLASEVGCVIVINPRRHGKYIAGAGSKIMPPEFLRQYDPGTIVVMNPIYKEEISEMAASMGLGADVITV